MSDAPAEPRYRNAVGSYSGAYAVYRALAVATRALARDHRPDFTDTAPATLIGPHPQWGDPAKIVSLDPWGHLVGEVFAEQIRAGIDIRPTIAVTRARITTPELRPLLADGTLRPDGEVLLGNGEIRVTKAAIDPVWHLPGLATRFGVAEADLRRFGSAITELQQRVGDYFAPAQGGRFASPHVAAALAWLESAGVAGFGQSSWGPTGFAFAPSRADAERMAALARRHPNARMLDIRICVGLNRGAEVVAHELRTS